jgi:ACS family tartrate transporter-like MFS transporter
MAGSGIGTQGGARDDRVPETTISRVTRRLVPFLILCYFVAYLDRVNVGFAALTMNKELGISPTLYAWGAGIFFIGYFLFEVPSNIILEKAGARRWIARIMISWGILSSLMAVVWNGPSFLTLRFLLGVAEAGFFPGIILYLTYWFPSEHRGRIVGAFMVAIPVSSVIGAPVSGYLLGLDGILGLAGWQWLFILEGVPSVLIGFVVLFYLTDRPQAAAWLAPAEREWLGQRLELERRQREEIQHFTLGEALKHPRVVGLSLVYFGVVAALYGLGFWLPQIVKGFGLSNIETGFVTAIPYLFGAIAMVIWGKSSDRTGERKWHVAGAALLGAVGLGASAYFSSPLLTIVALCVSALGIFSALPVFWTLPTAMLTGTAAAGGIALINSIGNLAGFAGPYLIGWIKESTGEFSWALLALAVAPLISAAITLLLGHNPALERLPKGAVAYAGGEGAVQR